MGKIIYKLIRLLVKIQIILYLTSVSLITCAPISADELCSVSLVPNEMIAKRYQESVITIRCEAILDSGLLAKSFGFTNPVFDMSFGGAPRTGLFILRGNTTCDESKVKCWSDYRIAANSIGHLIQHSGNIVYSCQVADQIRSATNKTQARCQGTGSLKFSNTLKYGDPCETRDTDRECDKDMECGPPEVENESESRQQCICRNGLVSIPFPSRSTVCVEEVPLGSICNFTKQCSAVDSNAICDYNKYGIKVCQCSQQSIEVTQYQTDYIKKCQIKSTTTSSTSTASPDEYDTNITKENSSDISHDNIIDGEKGYKYNSNKDEKAGNVGIILFFVAIFLAIIIVVIIIRARNKSDKMVINKKRTTEQQTDDNDGEQNEPILTTDSGGGVDEVDDTTEDVEQINNKINESQKIQTNV